MTRIARWATAAAAVVASLGAFAAPASAVGPDQYGGYNTEVYTAGCPSGPGHQADPHRPGDRLAIDADDAAAFYRCHPSTSGRAVSREHVNCAPGAYFDWTRGLCGPARKVPEMGTKLTAGRAGLTHLSPLKARLGHLNATLVRDRDNGPQDAIWNATITFKDGAGNVLCVARTNTAGRAACDAEHSVNPATTLLGGYTAEYAGNGSVDGTLNTLAPATARGGVL
ncbi:hypothetical protein [Streptomyces natalensis]|uniref:40-residue YVTN family beta-propeller repeat-containing protein n=1 Tax=Streptomyces natalensis ATCC 27448 TaxID=1240678 RepID=A0A0D7CH40_9ACTN|nr:hypothetical protein [Streptomyces natalensis]KIZ15589.1 40-residue YVTN family beta-propeller repeat-containing protein [Streptomyces natalensis ATCC 27448]